LHRLDTIGGSLSTWQLPGLCGAVVLSNVTRKVVIALDSGVSTFDTDTAQLRLLVEVEPATLGNRLNDSKCDRLGRLWTTSMRDRGAAIAGSLYSIDADLCVTRHLKNLGVPNALCWSPSSETLYFADSMDGRIRSFDFDIDKGTLESERTLLVPDALPGKPDGATTDAEGCIWNARYGGGCIARITPDGRIDRIIEVPTPQVTSCAFGDSDLRTLYITTARQNLTAGSDDNKLAGHLFAVRLEVEGLPEAGFRINLDQR
jgi:sugar lactone lactonase YvrE